MAYTSALERDDLSRAVPDALALARLVSAVTEAMCGTVFEPGNSSPASPVGRPLVMLPFTGRREVTVVMEVDEAVERALASALYGCPDQNLDPEMICDAVKELLNMVAGQVRLQLAIDQPLGLPRSTTFAEFFEYVGDALDQFIALQSRGIGDLKMWVVEKVAPANCRSLFQPGC